MPMTMTRGALVLALLLVACGDDSRSPADAGIGVDAGPLPDGATLPDAGPRADAGELPDGALPPDGGGATDAGAPAEPLDLCLQACVTADDCGTDLGAFSADNYECDSGACRYGGCRDDEECNVSLAGGDYACRELPGAGLRGCTRRCTTESDCATTSPAFDADNYRCDGGFCEYLGCNDDPECAAAFPTGDYVCAEAEPVDTGLPLPVALRNCVQRCAIDADCDLGSAAWDTDNHECVGGVCRYRGCNDDAECAATFPVGEYVCR